MSHRELRYDAVILDVGGTLLGFHDYTPFREFLAEASLPHNDEEVSRLHRRLTDLIIARRDGAQGLGARGEELHDWWRGIFGETWLERPDLAQKMLDWLFAGRFDRLFDDSLPALEALQVLGLQLGVLSNFGVHLRDVLQRFGLLPFFDFVVVSAEVGLAKPDPRIFEKVAQETGAPRERLLYVGDHLGDDIEGAWGAGLGAVLIDRSGRHQEALCPRISSLRHLAQYVQLPDRPAQALLFDLDGMVPDSMLLAGLGPLLHDLRGRGYRLGLVTGSAREVAEQALAPAGVAALFETMVTGDEVARGKPASEPYQRAAGRLGLPPGRCLVVENAPLGIQAAKAAGMRCVALETTLLAQRLLEAGAERAFPSVPALRAWLLARWLGASS